MGDHMAAITQVLLELRADLSAPQESVLDLQIHELEALSSDLGRELAPALPQVPLPAMVPGRAPCAEDQIAADGNGNTKTVEEPVEKNLRESFGRFSSKSSNVSNIMGCDNQHMQHVSELAEKQKMSVGRQKGVGYNKAAKHVFVQGVESTIFKTLSTFFILANTAFIGLETDTNMKRLLEDPPRGPPEWHQLADHTFTAVFTFELVVRIIAYRTKFFISDDALWNIFDLFLVLSQLLEEFLVSGDLSSIRIIRLTRLVRTLRIVRIIHFFRHLRMLVCCIFNSLMSLMWALVLLVLVMYLFSIVCVQGAYFYLSGDWLVSPDFSVQTDDLSHDELRRMLELNFRSILRAIFAMLACISGGVDWYRVVQPLMCISPVYTFAFSFYIVFVLFGVLNVMSAVFVEHALKIRDRDLLIQSEMSQTDTFMKDMLELFQEADSNNNGWLTQEELHAYLMDPRVAAYMSGMQLDVSDVASMFELLDANQSGGVEMHEFVLGTHRLKGHARCLDVIRLFQVMTSLQEQLNNIQAVLPRVPA